MITSYLVWAGLVARVGVSDTFQRWAIHLRTLHLACATLLLSCACSKQSTPEIELSNVGEALNASDCNAAGSVGICGPKPNLDEFFEPPCNPALQSCDGSLDPGPDDCRAL